MAIAGDAGQKLTKEQVMQLVDEHFPQVQEGNGRISMELLAARTAHLRMACDPRSIRPGGTVAGPAMFKLADFSVYALILAELGPEAMPAATTSMTINFLSRPQAGDIVARARLIKLGRRLAVAEVEIYSDGKPEMVAHATSTYALPVVKS
ncbi:MAG: PaaI family thioesterase [Hyphomicrobiaceae bacterium]|nr:PaaI family thioesterase [Hyphomicrobiaceae bacterium]